MNEMELIGVRVELPSNNPIVLLREIEGGRRLLPIFIGGPEATAIAFALEGVETPRPLTHDLLQNLLAELGVTVERVVVTDLSDSTFFAELHLVAGDQRHQISCRPSDAIALAARVKCPIYAETTVLDEAGHHEPEPEADGTEAEEVVEEFREFIEKVNPDDFGS